MGRPINKKYIGNTSTTGQQIQSTAYIPGDIGTSTAYISAQKGTSRYNVTNVSGYSSGTVVLVDGGVSLSAGQANVTVAPYGSTGSGAAASARLGVYSADIVSAGSGDTTNYYVPGEVLTTTSGTATAKANLYVQSVTLGSAIVNNAGTKYTVGDTLTWGYAGYGTPVVLTVAGAGSAGNIISLSYTVPGNVTNVSVTNTIPYSSSVTSNVDASGATFKIRWDVAELTIKDIGNYSSAPADHVALTGSTKGTGATADVVWQVSSVAVTNGGSGYQAANVTFGSGTASAVATVNAAGSITTVTVQAPGDTYTNTLPGVTIAPISSTKYARKITNRIVETFENNEYEWVDSATTPVDGQAQIQTA